MATAVAPVHADVATALRRAVTLRSSGQVVGRHVHAVNGDVGRVDDVIIDHADWTIRYLIVNTRHWLLGKKVLVSPAWIDTLLWSERTIRVDFTREQITGSPRYNPKVFIDREYETCLHEHYGRPVYW